jgi:aminoglycoside phosphotransferase (APT) family kinase protein
MGREGVRVEWSAIPEAMRAEIDAIAGAPIIAVSNLRGGFSPGPAACCELADGRRVFVKAAGTSLNPIAPAMHRREARVLRVLPASAPAPHLLGVADDGDWVALVIEWIDGRMPVAPLDRADVAAALETASALAAVDATALRESLVGGGTTGAGLHGHWSKLLSEPVDTLDPWSSRHLGRLADLEASWDDAVRGNNLVHGDFRVDNLLITDSAPVIVDWPSAAVGAPFIDLLGLLPSLHLDGGPAPAEIFDTHPIGASADPNAVDTVLAAIAGYFTRQALLPPPPGLPTVRAFQAAQGAIARRWLAERLGWR